MTEIAGEGGQEMQEGGLRGIIEWQKKESGDLKCSDCVEMDIVKAWNELGRKLKELEGEVSRLIREKKAKVDRDNALLADRQSSTRIQYGQDIKELEDVLGPEVGK